MLRTAVECPALDACRSNGHSGRPQPTLTSNKAGLTDARMEVLQ